jgi:hypothetical protein
MEALSAFELILRDLLIFIVAMSVVLAALLVIISRMPNDNPLKRILVALSYRVGATAAVGMLVIPATPRNLRHEIRKGQRPRHAHPRPGAPRRAAARLHQFPRH